MEAKDIRDMIKIAERRAKNVYMTRKNLKGEPLAPVRIINAREHKGFTQVLTIRGHWLDAEFGIGEGAIYAQ